VIMVYQKHTLHISF